MTRRDDRLAVAQIAEEHPEALAAVRDDGSILWRNRQFRACFRELPAGAGLADLCGLGDAALEQLLRRAFSAPPATVLCLDGAVAAGDGAATPLDAWRLQDHDPALAVFRFCGRPVAGEGELTPTAARERLSKETATRQQVERRLHRAMGRATGRAMDSLAKASLARDGLLAEISHDVRTPLNAIIGFSEAMANGVWGKLDERYQGYVEDIRASGLLLLDFVEQVLEPYQERGGFAPPRLEGGVDLSACLEHCLQAVAPLASRKSLRLQAPEAAGLPRLRVAPNLLTTVLLNLIDNAVKFSQEGGRILVSIDRDPDHGLEIAVRDEGPGIPDDQLGRVLKPFYRARDSYVSGPPGYGLGLSTAKCLLDGVGGELRLVSCLGEGTAALVHLPPALVEWRAAG